MCKIDMEYILNHPNEVIMFRYYSWDSPVKAKVIVHPGDYISYDGRKIKVHSYECPSAIYLEKPEDRCAYCGSIDEAVAEGRAELSLLVVNKGKS